MRRCPKCGRAYSDFVEICPQCNISLTGNSENASRQTQEDVSTARNASQERRVEHKATAETVSVKKPSTKRKILPVAIVALVLVAAIILVFSGAFRTSDSNEAVGNNIEAASGSGTSGSGTSGSGTFSSDTSGSGTSGSGTSGSDTSGSGTSGSDTSGSGTFSSDTSGSGTSGSDTFGSDEVSGNDTRNDFESAGLPEQEEPTKSQETVSAPEYTDYMTATVNGEYYEFQLTESEIVNDKIRVSYICYDGRVDKLYTIKLYFDKRIAVGSYSSDNGDTEFEVSSGSLFAQSEVNGSVMGAVVPVQEGAGSFSMKLTYRSDDWTAYAGSFSAELGRTSNSGTYGDSSMTIEDAEFSFTVE